jgi:hypothetical protein
LILLQIVALPEDKQRALKHVMLTCKQLLPVAKETLLIEPCVQLHRIHALNHRYKKHPELASKVTTLELRANDQEGCVCTHQNGIIAYSALRGFSALIRLLPNLTTLLLGANQLKDITPLHFLLAPRGSLFCPHHGFTAPRHPHPIATLPSHFYPAIASRITSLELPVVWTQQWNKDHYTNSVDVSWQLRGFTSLKHLSLPYPAFYGAINEDDLANEMMPFPETLTSLTISKLCGCTLRRLLWCLYVMIVVHNKGQELSRIDIWCNKRATPEIYPVVGALHDETQIQDLRNGIMEYVAWVDIHYDEFHSDWIRETALARERNGRKVGEVEYFGRESRGCFERFRGEVNRRVIEGRAQAEWLEEEEDRILEERERREREERKRRDKAFQRALEFARQRASMLDSFIATWNELVSSGGDASEAELSEPVRSEAEGLAAYALEVYTSEANKSGTYTSNASTSSASTFDLMSSQTDMSQAWFSETAYIQTFSRRTEDGEEEE